MKNDAENIRSTHTIRLRGPCWLLWMQNGTQQVKARVQIPGKIEPGIFESQPKIAADVFLLRRSFHRPTGLVESQNVILELSGFEGATRVAVNRDSDEVAIHDFAEGGDSLSFSVTASLLQNNTLEVEFGSLPAVAGEVQLVIAE